MTTVFVKRVGIVELGDGRNQVVKLLDDLLRNFHLLRICVTSLASKFRKCNNFSDFFERCLPADRFEAIAATSSLWLVAALPGATLHLGSTGGNGLQQLDQHLDVPVNQSDCFVVQPVGLGT